MHVEEKLMREKDRGQVEDPLGMLGRAVGVGIKHADIRKVMQM